MQESLKIIPFYHIEDITHDKFEGKIMVIINKSSLQCMKGFKCEYRIVSDQTIKLEGTLRFMDN